MAQAKAKAKAQAQAQAQAPAVQGGAQVAQYIPYSQQVVWNTESTAIIRDEKGAHFEYTEKVKKDDTEVEVKHTCFDPAIVSVYEKVEFLTQVGNESRKALCIELAGVTREMVKKAGFKGGFNAFISNCFGARLDPNTAQKYRKVGRVFGIKTEMEGKVGYRWKEPIAVNVSVTNLSQVLGLVDLPKNWEELTDAEMEKVYLKFAQAYIYSGRINLDCTLSDLREAIRKVQNDIDGTGLATEQKGAQGAQDEQDEQKGAQDAQDAQDEQDEHIDDEQEVLTVYLDAFRVHFKGNDEALSLIAKLAELLG